MIIISDTKLFLSVIAITFSKYTFQYNWLARSNVNITVNSRIRKAKFIVCVSHDQRISPT